MSRRPGIVWIFARVLLTAVGVFVAAAVVGWVAHLLSGRRKRQIQSDRVTDATGGTVDPRTLGFPEENVLDVTFSEVEEVHR